MNKEKELYETPDLTVIDVKTEGVICASSVDATGLGFGDYNNPFGDEMVL